MTIKDSFLFARLRNSEHLGDTYWKTRRMILNQSEEREFPQTIKGVVVLIKCKPVGLYANLDGMCGVIYEGSYKTKKVHRFFDKRV